MDAPSGMRRWVDWANILSTVFPKAWPFSRLMREAMSLPMPAMVRSGKLSPGACVPAAPAPMIMCARMAASASPANRLS